MDALPPEIHWNIFMMNTERDNKTLEMYIPDSADHRLDTARNCSQVCRLWRALLLQLSSVWGRLLHLQNLEHTTDAWREAVASRIGEASLWITGEVTDSTRPFIFPILEEKWQNVQVLEISDESLFSNKVLPTWSFLEKEAPKLELFRLSAHMVDAIGLELEVPMHILPFSPLFGNTAPRLKIFTLEEAFHLSLPAPWMANLHSVTFYKPQNGPLLLSALKSMPLLRELDVYGGNALQPMFSAQDGDLDKPHLPLLESLTLDPFYYPMDMILLLESITLPPGQRLLRKLVIPEVFKDHQRVHCAVTKWIHAYMSASPPRHLSLSADYQRILTLEDIRDIGSGEGMRVDIVLDDTQSHVTIEEIAASLRYSVVEELDVALTDSDFARPLRPLFAVLQSVTRLTVDGHHLEPLFHVMLQFSLFPNLHTIYFRGTSLHPDRNNCEEANTLATLKRFLEHRVQIGSPVSVLDLSSVHLTALPNNLNMERLIQIPGLSVVLPEDRKV
ncbi:hypothetical protein CPC08DRAFT_717418 [Agrocybe pediades]|nr:hypothetical protein CPC08DRAFT_717418 [Agrocybe pediades]